MFIQTLVFGTGNANISCFTVYFPYQKIIKNGNFLLP
jgi:hypothetical protein